MALMRPSFKCKITQQLAEGRTSDGVCGDITHIKSTKLVDCTSEKALVVYKDDATFSIIHVDEVAPWTIEGLQRDHPIVQKACDGSRKMLNKMLEVEKARVEKDAAHRKSEETKVRKDSVKAKQVEKRAPPAVSFGAAEICAIAPAIKTSTTTNIHTSTIAVGEKPNTVASAMTSVMAGKFPEDDGKETVTLCEVKAAVKRVADTETAPVQSVVEDGWEVVDDMVEWDVMEDCE
ncbi:hypothetical protein LTR56_022750 [Elasticomyces elasticus]|nr:hypothetical protein LTR56_022750 [Elasticomyces elasticus]KAK3627812.1 hypothetical protein LTR22_022584 [Elasticomyces elasticus]KAK4907908.1 hypothetical protein LTR49_023111 [Elasticomyces elasticus]KAK5748036.1 hypothetical protein LTS12_021896 [Elasticomyces elasticus]